MKTEKYSFLDTLQDFVESYLPLKRDAATKRWNHTKQHTVCFWINYIIKKTCQPTRLLLTSLIIEPFPDSWIGSKMSVNAVRGQGTKGLLRLILSPTMP